MVDTVRCPMWQFGVKMNIDQARAKLADVSRSTGTKHPKVLVAELCTVVKFLLDEIDRIKSPPISTLSQCKRPIEELPRVTTPPPSEEDPSKFYPDHPHRKGSAGDAE